MDRTATPEGTTMLVDTDDLESAGWIPPGEAVYVVAFASRHPTLRAGDRVKAVALDANNLFIRLADLTVHRIDHDGEYVVVVPSGTTTRRG